MRGLGRLLALPWLLIALAVQADASADAAMMQPNIAQRGICSAHELGDAHRPEPAKRHDHDCCAFACALCGLSLVPPALAATAKERFPAPAEVTTGGRLGIASPSPVERPRSRGPPTFGPLSI